MDLAYTNAISKLREAAESFAPPDPWFLRRVYAEVRIDSDRNGHTSVSSHAAVEFGTYARVWSTVKRAYVLTTIATRTARSLSASCPGTDVVDVCHLLTVKLQGIRAGRTDWETPWGNRPVTPRRDWRKPAALSPTSAPLTPTPPDEGQGASPPASREAAIQGLVRAVVEAHRAPDAVLEVCADLAAGRSRPRAVEGWPPPGILTPPEYDAAHRLGHQIALSEALGGFAWVERNPTHEHAGGESAVVRSSPMGVLPRDWPNVMTLLCWTNDPPSQAEMEELCIGVADDMPLFAVVRRPAEGLGRAVTVVSRRGVDLIRGALDKKPLPMGSA